MRTDRAIERVRETYRENRRVLAGAGKSTRNVRWSNSRIRQSRAFCLCVIVHSSEWLKWAQEEKKTHPHWFRWWQWSRWRWWCVQNRGCHYSTNWNHKTRTRKKEWNSTNKTNPKKPALTHTNLHTYKNTHSHTTHKRVCLCTETAKKKSSPATWTCSRSSSSNGNSNAIAALQ